MRDTKLLGRFGEAAAADYLRKKGYTLLGLNYRTRLGEIDLIASKGRYLVFAEVKLRRDGAFAEAREFVTPAKQKRIIAAAQEWMQRTPTSLQPRFDVMEVYAPEGTATAKPVIRHWENAFGAE
ncbi:MAG: YraN family protein [Oscillospiraceae bacterium]|nr:YraN family protein [Oscillospiraceae bacterium]